jgi:hypothetical protein
LRVKNSENVASALYRHTGRVEKAVADGGRKSPLYWGSTCSSQAIHTHLNYMAFQRVPFLLASHKIRFLSRSDKLHGLESLLIL